MKKYDLVIKTGEYTNQQGETKGRYTNLGAVMQGDNGFYAIIDPAVDLAGCLVKQNVMNSNNGREVRDSVMCSMFEPQQGGQQQSNNVHNGNSSNQGGFQPDQNIPF